ncbi:MAG TPA: hypothetical protein PKD79_00060 [Candidatus Doudnabacteria bacterium]|nr:hypothetical protein [Candidatus Doudnabacteria bacterium]
MLNSFVVIIIGVSALFFGGKYWFSFLTNNLITTGVLVWLIVWVAVLAILAMAAKDRLLIYFFSIITWLVVAITIIKLGYLMITTTQGNETSMLKYAIPMGLCTFIAITIEWYHDWKKSP